MKRSFECTENGKSVDELSSCDQQKKLTKSIMEKRLPYPYTSHHGHVSDSHDSDSASNVSLTRGNTMSLSDSLLSSSFASNNDSSIDVDSIDIQKNNSNHTDTATVSGSACVVSSNNSRLIKLMQQGELPVNIEDWNTANVCNWLSCVGFNHLQSMFQGGK